VEPRRWQDNGLQHQEQQVSILKVISCVETLALPLIIDFVREDMQQQRENNSNLTEVTL
jgi:hypothetical protein